MPDIDFNRSLEEIQRQIEERDTANGVYTTLDCVGTDGSKVSLEQYPAASTHGGAAVKHTGE